MASAQLTQANALADDSAAMPPPEVPATSMTLPSTSAEDPEPPSGPVCYQLSEKISATAHPGDKWKSGYLTITRKPPAGRDSAPAKSRGRNVHLSKRSFEKLGQHLEDFQKALKGKSDFQLMLTKKQHMLTSKFARDDKETLYYVGFMHPVHEKESLEETDPISHFKTINLSEAEFLKLVSVYEKLSVVVNLKITTPRGENEESITIEGYRWTHRTSGTRSAKVFLTLSQCEDDSSVHNFNLHDMQAQPMECDYKLSYDYEKVTVDRPNKYEVIEHLAYLKACQELKNIKSLPDDGPPHPEDIELVLFKFEHIPFTVLVKKVLMKLSYKSVYLCTEFVNMFLYFGGLEKVRNNLIAHHVSGSGKMYTRLLHYCYDVACDEMN